MLFFFRSVAAVEARQAQVNASLATAAAATNALPALEAAITHKVPELESALRNADNANKALANKVWQGEEAGGEGCEEIM